MCNLLFSWARGYVVAQRYGIPYAVLGWQRVRIGPWLRRERVRRYYGSYFCPTGTWMHRLRYRLQKRLASQQLLIEPPLDALTPDTPCTVVFNAVPNPRTKPLFEDLHPHRDLLRSGLRTLVRRPLLARADALTPPFIAVHIRRGDFRNHPLFLDDDYYLSIIRELRNLHGPTTPVTIFSDGYPAELRRFTDLPAVTLADSDHDLIDLLQLSRSRILVSSLCSTFSYWAGFLSDAAILLHPRHHGGAIRPPTEGLFEGTLQAYRQWVSGAEGPAALSNDRLDRRLYDH